LKGEQDASRALYGIAVAAELLGVGEQTLRLFERKGLVVPFRSAGGTRRYSNNDLATMRRVIELLNDGLNLAGAKRVIELEKANERLQRRFDARPN
jgi:MerR family transcriptional regulator/heat shock protein HspR